jgi:radical SAM protein with 4Fe4S-binding SPASM domain
MKYRFIRKFNSYLNKAEIILGRERLLSLPRYVQIEPTNRCNQLCVMCPRQSQMDVPLGDMNFEQFKYILDRIFTIQNLQLNGLGEPFLNKDIIKMIKLADQRGINVSINSNLGVVNKQMAEEIVKSGLKLLKVSFDSADPVVYQEIRGASMPQMIQGLNHIVAARQARGLKKPIINFNSIIMTRNRANLVDILKFAEQAGVDAVRFKSLGLFASSTKDSLDVSSAQLLADLKKARDEARSLSIENNLDELIENIDTYRRPVGKYPCYIPWLEVYVQYYGGVRLCCNLFSRQYDLGNIFEEDFRKIWNSQNLITARREFKKGNLYFPACTSCNIFKANLEIDKKVKKVKKTLPFVR